MLTLVIQTVLNRIDLALLSGEILLAVESWDSQKDEVKKVLPAIELILGDYGFSWLEINQIVVVVGQGNFSSTRIGVTIANILSMASSAKIFELEMKGEFGVKELLDTVEKKLKEGWTESVLAKPIYRSDPMISPSKKKKFTK